MRFGQRHAIITGGSSGIGKATAVLLAREGCHISIVSRSQEKLDAARDEIASVASGPGQKVFAASADVAEEAQVQEAVRRAVEEVGPPDLLVTSAGIAHPGYFSELPTEVFERTMAVNYFGSLYAAKAVAPSMIERKSGQICLISSGAALIGIYGYSPYSPTKFALKGLAECLRAELKPSGISVTIAYPPDTDTPQLAEENRAKPYETKKITQTGGLWSAERVARAIVLGLVRKKFIVAPGFQMWFMARFGSLALPAMNFWFDRIAAKARAERPGKGNGKGSSP